MSNFWISYKTTRDQYPLDFQNWDLDKHKITLFKEQVIGWQLDIAKYLLFGDGDKIPPHKHSAFAALSILMSYFENIARYLDGCEHDDFTRSYFIKGLLYVYENTSIVISEIQAGDLYKDLRCGLHHIGLSKRKIVLAEGPIGLIFQEDKIIVAPTQVYKEILTHFNKYCFDLDSNPNLRTNFEKRFNWAKTH